MHCHIMIANRNERVLSVSDRMPNTATFASGSPKVSSSISSYSSSLRTPAVAMGASRTLQEMMMDLRVLPAATLKFL